VRDHESEGERAHPLRPAQAADARSKDDPSLSRAAAAAVSGRPAAVGAAGMLHLQRSAGNAGVTAAISGPLGDGEAAIQREMGGGEGAKPLYPSYGEGEEEI
jgi:hypothetical protein